MKRSYVLLLSAAGVFTAHCSQNYNPAPQVAMAQTSLDDIIAQANLDPVVAQALTDEVNNLTQQASANLQQDNQDISVAAGATTLLEIAQHMAKTNSSLAPFASLIQSLKYSAHANIVQKFLIGVFPAQLRNDLYYTDPYTETAGFILNDYLSNIFFTALVTTIAPTAFGQALKLNTSSPTTALATQIAAGIAAYCTWLLEKKFIVLPFLQQLQANSQQNQNS